MNVNGDSGDVGRADGASPESTAGPPLERLGRYRILGELGRGGMGIVLLAEDPDLQRQVAIKTIPRELAEDPESYARFQREARLLASLNHPNVATVHSLEVIDGAPILTMERIVGETLASHLVVGALPVGEVLRIGTKIARAIEAAHERNVIHRDLKPGNVMLREDGEVKVLDFGLAKALSGPIPAQREDVAPDLARLAGADLGADVTVLVPRSDLPDPGDCPSGSQTDTSRSGTLGYMSPEQILGLPVDERTDLFAFGCVLYECATGSRAFAGDTHTDRAHSTLSGSPSLDRLPAALPQPVRATIEGCLAKEPGNRPASASTVRKVLEECLERFLFRERSKHLGTDDAEGKEGCPHNLPSAQTTFVGRAQELRAVGDLLAAHAQVTLTGAGGSGKTRLAIEVARAFPREDLTGGVWLVELASLTHPSLLEKTIMTTVGIPEGTDRPALDSILDHFRSSKALIVLDNCEHLLDASAAFVKALLQRCGGVRVLATSRELLGLPGEHRFVVPPLSSHDLSGDLSAEELRSAEAVTLFTERARQVRPGFQVTAGNLSAVVGICRRLDGLPLALELAASRIRVLEPQALLDRLDDRFRILTGGSREALAHHRTLLASIEWSHDQLDEKERVLFRRLGVFVGGFSLDSVESVCVDQNLQSWDVLDGLSSLIDKSLIEPAHHRERDDSAAPRYRMLETFREYANQQSRASGESAAIRDRFVQYWKDTTRRAADQLNGPEAKVFLVKLDNDLGNIREAIRIALTEIEDVQVALALTGNLMGYWMRRAHWSEGTEFLRCALERPGAEARTRARAVALNSSGIMKYLTGRYAASITYLEEAIDIFIEHGMFYEAALGRTNVGNTYSFLGQFRNALDEHEAVLQTARELKHEWLTAVALINICNSSEAIGEFDRVEAAAREAVEILERLGDRTNMVMAQNYLGAVAYRRGRYLEGLTIFNQTLAIAVEHADRYNIGHQRLHRGLCLTALKRHDEALEDYRAALQIAHEFDEPNLLTSSVEAYAHRSSGRGEFAEALIFLSLADRLRAERSTPQRDANVRDIEELRAQLRDALGDEDHARFETEGRRMTVEEMIARVQAM